MERHLRRFDPAMTELLTAEASRLGETIDAFIGRSVALRLLGQLERRHDPRCDDYWSAFEQAGLIPSPQATVQQTVIDDPARLKTLADTGMLDTAASGFFDEVVAVAAEALGVPAAAITVVDRDRHIFWSSVGMTAMAVHSPEIPLKRSVAQHIVTTGQPLIVADARNTPVLRQHPVVLDGSLGAYLGFPLTSSAGHTIGALSVADPEPHHWGQAHVDILEQLTKTVSDRIFA